MRLTGGFNMRTKVYLADLRYNYSGVLANDCMPLGVAYMKAVMDRDCPQVDSRLFAYPDKLLEAMEPERHVADVERHPEIDVYILGEADFLARGSCCTLPASIMNLPGWVRLNRRPASIVCPMQPGRGTRRWKRFRRLG